MGVGIDQSADIADSFRFAKDFQGGRAAFPSQNHQFEEVRTARSTMSLEAPDRLELARLEKLQQIENLGLDPWGERFDGQGDDHRVIA